MSDCSDEQYADLRNFHQSNHGRSRSKKHCKSIPRIRYYFLSDLSLFFVQGINQSTFLPSNIADSTFQSLHFLHHTPPRVLLLSKYAESDAGENNPPVETRAGVRRVRENKHQIVALVWWDRGHTFWVRIKWLHTPAFQVPHTLIRLSKQSN